eukprot:1314311-Prymnesium_polylepis.1
MHAPGKYHPRNPRNVPISSSSHPGAPVPTVVEPCARRPTARAQPLSPSLARSQAWASASPA